MSIRHLSYVACNCCGDPGEAVNDAEEARMWAQQAGWTRVGREDFCAMCSVPGHGDALIVGRCRPDLFGSAY